MCKCAPHNVTPDLIRGLAGIVKKSPAMRNKSVERNVQDSGTLAGMTRNEWNTGRACTELHDRVE